MNDWFAEHLQTLRIRSLDRRLRKLRRWTRRDCSVGRELQKQQLVSRQKAKGDADSVPS